MKDRVPSNPGRVLVTPENGNTAYYATITRADNPQQEGTPINKNTLLKDETAALFGLGEDAVVDDVFGIIKNQAPFLSDYVWKRRSYQLRTEPEITSYSLTISGGTRYRATSFTVDYSTGIFTLVDASTTSQNVNCRGYYWIKGSSSGTTMYYSASNASFSESYISVDEYSAAPIIGEWEYIKDASRNAYPDSGVVNGYEYAYHGIAKELMFSGVKIATGSYIGTDKYGSSNPCTLTFAFEPKLLIVYGKSYSDGYSQRAIFPWRAECVLTENAMMWNNSNYNGALTASYTGNTVNWYNDNRATNQLNGPYTYYYVAIG